MDRKEKRLRANTKRSTKDERPQLAGVLSQSTAVPRVATKRGVCRSPERPTPSEPLSSSFHGFRGVTRSVRSAMPSFFLLVAPATWIADVDRRRGAARSLPHRHARQLAQAPRALLLPRRIQPAGLLDVVARRRGLHTPTGHTPTVNSDSPRREGSAPPQAPTPEARTSIFPLGRPPRRAYAHHDPLAASTIRRRPRRHLLRESTALTPESFSAVAPSAARCDARADAAYTRVTASPRRYASSCIRDVAVYVICFYIRIYI